MDTDIEYACEAFLKWGVFIHTWRTSQHASLTRCLQALYPLCAAFAPLRSHTAQAVAADRDVAGLAFLTSLLRWPDVTQASGYLDGFKVVGEIETSRVFRAIPAVPLDDCFSVRQQRQRCVRQ